MITLSYVFHFSIILFNFESQKNFVTDRWWLLNSPPLIINQNIKGQNIN